VSESGVLGRTVGFTGMKLKKSGGKRCIMRSFEICTHPQIRILIKINKGTMGKACSSIGRE
jgi:hypothetical protein